MVQVSEHERVARLADGVNNSYGLSHRDTQLTIGTNPGSELVAPPVIQAQSAVTLNDEIRIKQGRKNPKIMATQRYCCGCFKTRQRCIAICSLVFLVLFGALGAATFLLWPKVPTLDIGQPYTLPNGGGLEISALGDIREALANASPRRPFTLAYQYYVDVSVKSDNFIDYAVSALRFKGRFLNVETGAPIESFTAGGNVTNVVFKAKSTSKFTLPVRIEYVATAPVNFNEDPAILILSESCLSSNPSPMRISYLVDVVVPLISWTGYNPSISNLVLVNCPPSVLELLGGIINVNQ